MDRDDFKVGEVYTFKKHFLDSDDYFTIGSKYRLRLIDKTTNGLDFQMDNGFWLSHKCLLTHKPLCRVKGNIYGD